jgi:3-deoxy-manno-octulosonate cytidylyltransferase (CMP-KDO synthetase)
MSFQVIIPARYASTRLEGKPLCEIKGRPMIAHVYEKAIQSGASKVIIATDDQRILEVAQQMGAECYLTNPNHLSGTDRIAEIILKLKIPDEEIIVNLQGDEPTMPPDLIKQVAVSLNEQPQAQVATLCEPFVEEKDIFNPNMVKVVRDQNNFALYFSRAPIPWVRKSFTNSSGQSGETGHFRHIGLYAYRAGFLKQIMQLPACNIENDEALEQLRVLYYGGKIYVATACEKVGFGVDTPEDLEKLRQII